MASSVRGNAACKLAPHRKVKAQDKIQVDDEHSHIYFYARLGSLLRPVMTLWWSAVRSLKSTGLAQNISAPVVLSYPHHEDAFRQIGRLKSSQTATNVCI